MFARDMLLAALAMTMPCASPLAQDTTATVTGSIVDTTGVAIVGAQVFVNRVGPRSTSDARGRFRLVSLAAGELMIVVRHLGYHSATVKLTLARGETREIAVRLAPLPVPLDTIVSEAQATSENLRRNGFYARQRAGFGYFLTRDEIERMRAIDLNDLLRRLPFLQVSERLGRTRVTTQNGTCRPVLYLDRMPVPDLDVIPVEIVDGVEWYHHAADVPVEFVRPRATCAALIIWTR
jgi:hypothetical protein